MRLTARVKKQVFREGPATPKILYKISNLDDFFQGFTPDFNYVHDFSNYQGRQRIILWKIRSYIPIITPYIRTLKPHFSEDPELSSASLT